jgi:hypothetical protein
VPAPFDKVKKQMLEKMDKDSNDVIVAAKLDTLRARLKVNDNLGEMAVDLGQVRESGPFTRSFFISGLGPEALVDSFIARAKPGDISGNIPYPSGGYLVAQYLGPDPIDSKDFEAKKTQIHDQLMDLPERGIIQGLRKKARVKILRPELKDAWKPEMAAPTADAGAPGGPPGR